MKLPSLEFQFQCLSTRFPELNVRQSSGWPVQSRPATVCLCPFLPRQPLQVSTTVYIIQHPHEETRVLRTVPLLAACLPPDRCHVIRGKRFKQGHHPELELMLSSPYTYVLYPSNDALNIEEVTMTTQLANQDTPPYNMVIIDGTWTQARDIYTANEIFHLPKQVKLSGTGVSEYVIRTQPTDNSLSTLETAAVAMAALERRPEIKEVLFAPLRALCKFQLECGAQPHQSKEYLKSRGLYKKPSPHHTPENRRLCKKTSPHNTTGKAGL
ncbi:tRNA-uridine aminocarboxypropyltransferase 2-like isoform X2 [Branchiostoma floridae x Branchiostoma belcheri]